MTRPHLDAEEWILRTAISPVPAAGQRGRGRGADGRRSDLDYHQAAAVKGFLTSQRLVNCLVAPAGTGKTRTMAAFAYAWIAETGCRVIGLPSRENAARVLASEGMTETYNLAQFLGKLPDTRRAPAARAGPRGRRPGGRRSDPGQHGRPAAHYADRTSGPGP